MKKLPIFLKKYFWDVSFSKLDKKESDLFIIERILEHGDLKAIKWMEENFSSKTIKKVIKNSRYLSSKSGNYWGAIYDINKKKITCLQKLSLQKQERIWKN